jgi:hypothetical protein
MEFLREHTPEKQNGKALEKHYICMAALQDAWGETKAQKEVGLKSPH